MFGSPEDMKASSSYCPLLGDHSYSIYYLFTKKDVEKQKIGAATLSVILPLLKECLGSGAECSSWCHFGPP